MSIPVEQSWWSCDGLPFAEEQRLEHIAAAGFDGVHRRLPDAAWVTRCHALGLHWSATGIFGTAAEIVTAAHQAWDAGARWMNLQIVGHEPTEQLLDAVELAQTQTGLRLRVETHRGRITQDLQRTLGFIAARPHLRLTLDLSHYVLAGEILDDTDAFASLMPVAGALHLRISNGEQIQIPLASNDAAIARFQQWWQQAHASAEQRGEPLCAAVCELGPPGYAMRDAAGREMSDRWQESQQLMAMIRSL